MNYIQVYVLTTNVYHRIAYRPTENDVVFLTGDIHDEFYDHFGNILSSNGGIFYEDIWENRYQDNVGSSHEFSYD